MHELKQVISWAEEAGSIAMDYYGKTTGTLKSDGTLVTEADGAVEKLLRKRIQEACPDHEVLGEEMGPSKGKVRSEYRWALDPIDGTVNFARGFSFWGISVGLCKNEIPVLGVVHFPILKETFWAEERKGAYLNGKRCRVSRGKESQDEELFIIPSYSSKFDFRFRFKVRSFGSAAAHLCYVARGACLGALLEGWKIWDVAAGLCILHEAGAQVTDLDGIPVISLGGQSGFPLLATAPSYHADALHGIGYHPERK